MTKPVVAIVGRQNVGKSTLLNRLAKKQIAITEDSPGTTRDRVTADIRWNGREFTMVDTGGLVAEPDPGLGQEVQAQVRAAIGDADVVVFLTDVRTGLTPFDKDIADMLRRAGKPVVLAANKADTLSLETHATEFYELSLGDPVAISAYHGRATDELLDRIDTLLPPPAPSAAGSESIGIAIVGRPGVGKSMLLNAILGKQRTIVGDNPGTTRDAIDTPIDFEGRSVLLIDTAGIRRRGRPDTGVERYSVVRSMRAIDRADIVLLVMDASEPSTGQDKHIAGYIQQAYKGIMLIVNKWDLVAGGDKREWKQAMQGEFQFASYAPLLFVSAKSGQGIRQIMPQTIQIYEERNKRVPTAAVNGVVQAAIAAHAPPPVNGKAIRIKYATQAQVNPPTFVFFVNDVRVHFSYRRFLENKLREAFGFTGTALRLVFKTGGAS